MDIQAPDGSVIKFPDEMALSEIEKVMQKEYPIQQEPSKALDVARSIGQGATEGIVSKINMPADLLELGKAYVTKPILYGANKVGILPDKLYGELLDDYNHSYLPSNQTMDVINAETGGEYKPQTTLGDYTRTVSQFVAGGPSSSEKGLVNKGIDYIKKAVVPAVTSEAAGQFTKGTEIEPFARLVGAGAGYGGTKLLERPQNPDLFLASRAGNITREDYMLAQALMDKAKAMGTPLSASEAIQQVTGGKSLLGDTQRVLEQTRTGGPVLRDFYASRPEANATAAENVFNQVAPVNQSPSQIGPTVQKAAQQRIDMIRNNINEKSRPYYEASRTDEIPTEAALKVQSNPAYNLAEQDVRSHPVLSPKIADLDANQIGVMDAAKKRLRAFYEKTNLEKDRQLASEYTAAEAQARDAMREASPNYAAALDIQNEGRARFLEPAQQGPIGQLAETPVLETQKKIIFSSNPAVGSEKEIADAVSKISGINEQAASDLVRQHLAGSFNEANQALSGGSNQFGGAKYASQVAGNAQQASNLESAIRALPNGDAKWQKVSDLLDVFKAQGRRAPVGSATEFNKMINESMGEGTPLQEMAATAITPSRWAKAGDYFNKWRYDKVASGASNILTNPKGADIIAQASKKMPLTLTDFYRPAPYLYQLQRGGR